MVQILQNTSTFASSSVSCDFFLLTFVIGLVLRRRNGTEKNIIIYYYYLWCTVSMSSLENDPLAPLNNGLENDPLAPLNNGLENDPLAPLNNRLDSMSVADPSCTF